ncbi:MAG: hypothetical protein WCK02_17665 [Bacteroidota bacterium]
MKNSTSIIQTTVIIAILLLLSNSVLNAQTCESAITIELKNKNGEVFEGQTVTLVSKNGLHTFSKESNAKGEASFIVPCNLIYIISVSNYTKKKEILAQKDADFFQTLIYEADMVEKAKILSMNEIEKSQLDNFALSMPTEVIVNGSVMKTPPNQNCYSSLILAVTNLTNAPLPGEFITFKASKRKNKTTAITDKDGKVSIYLLKGDSYTVNFPHSKNYASVEILYAKGTNSITMGLTYLGTKEMERMEKEEANRILAEENRIKAEYLRFKDECVLRKISEQEAIKLEIENKIAQNIKKQEAEELRKRELLKNAALLADEVKRIKTKCEKYGFTLEEGKKRGFANENKEEVVDILDRNKWDDKLILCDVTGSMRPYSSQLAIWYQLRYAVEKNPQFVFFNDDNRKPNYGVYYAPSKGIDSLCLKMSEVAAIYYGGDAAENNMGALINGTKLAKPFKEIIMIADNNAPVKDIELLSEFNLPVHIILCGPNNSYIGLDYLLIAWKTKGSIHTIEQDITEIASMSEGQEIMIKGNTYRIMGGRFVKISKV